MESVSGGRVSSAYGDAVARVLHNLRADVLRGPAESVGVAVVRDALGEPKVGDFEVRRAGEEQVLGLEVAVDHLEAMHHFILYFR